MTSANLRHFSRHFPHISRIKNLLSHNLLLSLGLGLLACSSSAADEGGNTTSSDIARGAYLMKIGDCVACHTAVGGRELAGGLPFETPFGAVYSTNITSDKETGIGKYSYEDFFDAMHHGVGINGNLYPAMPYTSYSLLTDDDTKAIYAYLMSTKPIKQANRDNDVYFPFNLRFGLKAWNLVAHDAKEFTPSKEKSEHWNRGNYLVNALGHCGECHTPRDTLFAMEQDKHFEGAIIEGLEASDIRPAELNRQNWTHEDLKSLFTEGYSRKGTVFGGMYPVVYHSFSHLTDDDMRAVSSYLLDTDEDIQPQALTFNGHKPELPGYTLYKGYCAGCHGQNGEGRPNVAPAMAGNATLDKASPHNIVAVMLKGIKSQHYNLTTSFYAMPGYADELSDEQIKDLANYLRLTWSTQPGNLDVKTIQSLKEVILEHE
ncbi:cytochrome c [Shewanella baltica]|uniref:Gluconate 2-dehydrogenase (Acceptor) n=1 Tax=Shewanella baltica (strain OS195) TaxID=399599 RepID=A9L3C8_SHEB9|nr:cytochrome c [Shewanella baltica]ABX48177.1 Gluconate 2-dehydrogenase (acceptor) [Shewanella baltica OS195]ADT93206.1 Gluconate 2-dehydrogenase (acceptor) [Shewanella baltica OS678]EHC05766.1 Gluconate 2-dehydrogenase (acceptor) [Shewanella baltica OS625]